jgi:GTPase
MDTAYLVTVSNNGTTLAELAELAKTLDIAVVGRTAAALKKANSRLFIGSGKAADIVLEAKRFGADLIIFDDDLSPSQQRNWEELTSIPVIDRRELILEIFAAHAKTKEAKLQIELAQLEYTLPRLKRAWTHLSRQQGGRRGTRGEGEKQIELDRRSILQRIAKVKKEIESISGQRDTRRKQRQKNLVPAASIIGYTNAGKSSLLNYCTKAEVLTENKLFATLDPTTREWELPGGTTLLLTDTVGFVRKLPHDLVQAFHSTLEESAYADFLIHLADASSSEIESHITTTKAVISDLGAGEKPLLLVFNKIDKLKDPRELSILRARYSDAVFISLKTGEGLAEFRDRVLLFIKEMYTPKSYEFPISRHDLVAFIHRHGEVLSKEYRDNVISIAAFVPEHARNALASYAL